MSFLSEIKKRRASLNHTSTRLTTTEGKTLLEESVQGVFTSRQIQDGSPSCPGFVVDYKPDLQVAEIIPSSLYLGSQDVTQDVDLIKLHGITDILSIGVSVPHLNQLPNLTYTHIPAFDLPDENIEVVLDKALPIIEGITNKEGCLYIHCNAGVSRAPTVVIAFLIAHRGYTFNEAFSWVKHQRPSTNPNPGFVHQLLGFERKIVIERS